MRIQRHEPKVFDVFPTGSERTIGPICNVLPEKLSQLSQTEARRGTVAEEKHTTTVKMSSFSNKFSEYTLTQLNEILEDDEKLTKMIQEMDEVC